MVLRAKNNPPPKGEGASRQWFLKAMIEERKIFALRFANGQIRCVDLKQVYHPYISTLAKKTSFPFGPLRPVKYMAFSVNCAGKLPMV